MSTLTIITVLVILFGVTNKRGYGRALALGGATPAGAALVLGATAVPTYDAVAIGAVVALFFHVLGTGPRSQVKSERLPPGALLLMFFLGWSTFVTLVAPMLFNGMPIVRVNATVLAAGVVTSSNIAQVGYLFIGVCVVVFLARSTMAGPEIIGLLLSTCTLLSSWRYLSTNYGVPFPGHLFDNAPFNAFIETAPGGEERFRGILSEPSALGGICLITIAYMITRAPWLTGWRRVGALALAGDALYLGIISTSTTFVVAGVATAVLMLTVFLFGFLSQRTLLSRIVGLLACAAAVVGVWLLPTLTLLLSSTLGDKVGTQSYHDRTLANTDSYRVFLDSYGFGVGLGSARASSFVPTILSATGVAGTALLIAAITVLIRQGYRYAEYRPVVWALVALLIGKISSGPDLSDSTGLLWISLGLLSHAGLAARRRPAGPPGRDVGPHLSPDVGSLTRASPMHGAGAGPGL